MEDLESLLLQADLGLDTAEGFVERVREQSRRGRLTDGDARRALAEHLREALAGAGAPLDLDARPGGRAGRGRERLGEDDHVREARLAAPQEGHSVLLGAGDTFRAAAIEQLERWGERIGVAGREPGAGRGPVGGGLRRGEGRAGPRRRRS